MSTPEAATLIVNATTLMFCVAVALINYRLHRLLRDGNAPDTTVLGAAPTAVPAADGQPLTTLMNEAVRIAIAYEDANAAHGHTTWRRSDYMIGFVGDVGKLAKLVMAQEGTRSMPGGHAALEHELADCLFSVLVLSHLYGVDLERAFHRTMSELDQRIGTDKTVTES